MNFKVSDLAGLAPAQDTAKEGLPFWLFWLLLSIILLLVLFIFLRDKNLRRRLSAFLSGAKRKMLRLRLLAKLKKEKQKKIELWKEIGRNARSEHIRIEQTSVINQKFDALEKELSRNQEKWHGIISRIETLEKERESARKNRLRLLDGEKALREPLEIRMTQIKESEIEIEKRPVPAASENRDTLAGLEAEKMRLGNEKAALQAELDLRRRKLREMERLYEEETRTREREIREAGKKRTQIQEAILEIKRAMEPLFESLGKILDEIRFENKELMFPYFQIDGIQKTIRDLENRIEKLQ